MIGADSRPLQVLIDYERDRNCGCVAMRDGIVTLLRQTVPNATLHIVGENTPPFRVRSLRWNPFGGNILHTQSKQTLWSRIVSMCAGLLRFGIAQPLVPFITAWQRWAGLYTLRHLAVRWREIRVLEEGDDAAPGESMRMRSLPEFSDRFDMLVLAGGILTDQFVPSLERHSALIHAFRAAGKPVLVTGKQLGPFASAEMATLVGKSLQQASFVGVREPTGSVEFCRQQGIEARGTGDDSFGLAAAPAPEVDAVLAAHQLERDRFIVVNVRTGFYAPEHRAHLARIAQLFDAIAERTRLPLLFVPIANNPWDSDRESGESLGRLMRTHLRFVETDRMSPGLVKGIVGAAHGVVASSYHCCVFGLQQGVPAVCLHAGAHYDQKAAGITALWNDERLAVSLMGMVDVVVTATRLDELFSTSAVRDILQKRSNELREDWTSQLRRHIVDADRSVAERIARRS